MLYLRAGKAAARLRPHGPLVRPDQLATDLAQGPAARANRKYDLIWIIEKWGIACTNFKFDTLLVGTLLNENRSNSLNLHAKLYHGDSAATTTPSTPNTTRARWRPSRIDDLLTYAGGDTDACQQVADIMREELGADDALTRFYVTILHPGARAFEKIERRGILIDQEKYAVLGEDLRKVIKIEQNKALSLLPNKMLCKYKDRIEEQIADGKNPLLPSILSEYFFTPHGLNLKPKENTPKTGAPSMKKSHLRAVRRPPCRG